MAVFNHDGNHEVCVSLVLSKIMNGNMTAPEIVLAIETIVMGVLTVFTLGNYIYGDKLSQKTATFLVGSLTGVGLFTSIMLLWQLCTICNGYTAIENTSIEKPVREYDRTKIACISVITLGFECSVAVAVSINSDLWIFVSVISAIFLIVQFGVAAYFTHACIMAFWHRDNDSQQPQSILHLITWLGVPGSCIFLHTMSIAGATNYAISSSTSPSDMFGSVVFLSITRMGVSLAQVASIRVIRFSHEEKSGVKEEDNSHTTTTLRKDHTDAPPSPSTPDKRPILPQINCEELDEARQIEIRKVFTDFDVATGVVNFESRGGEWRVRADDDVSRAHVVAFLRTRLQGDDVTWLDTLRMSRSPSQFIVPKVRLYDVDYDVRIHIPFAGEARISIQETPPVITSLEELHAHIRKTEKSASEKPTGTPSKFKQGSSRLKGKERSAAQSHERKQGRSARNRSEIKLEFKCTEPDTGERIGRQTDFFDSDSSARSDHSHESQFRMTNQRARETPQGEAQAPLAQFGIQSTTGQKARKPRSEVQSGIQPSTTAHNERKKKRKK